MKNIKFIILFVFLAGCLSTTRNIPSSMKVTPDTIQQASVLKQIYFYVECNGNEILKSLKITSNPAFFQIDSLVRPLLMRDSAARMPLAEAWRRPRVIPAPSPTAKRFSTPVSSSGERAIRLE